MKNSFNALSKIITDVSRELGINVDITNVVTSNDTDTQQLLALLTDGSEEILDSYPWTDMIGDDPWIMHSNGEYGTEFTADDDIPLIDARLLKLAARWRWLHAKGLTYAEDFRSFEIRKSRVAFHLKKGHTVNTNYEHYGPSANQKNWWYPY